MDAKIYAHPSVLDGNFGNNAFGRFSDAPNELFVPHRTFGTLDDVRPGSKPAFREFGTGGSPVEYPGLEAFVSARWNGIPLHVFDNHNHALAFWCEAFSNGVFDRGAILAHIDMHSDLWPNESDLDLSRSGDAAYVEAFVNEKTSVGTYVEPAMRSGMFAEFVRVEGEGDLRREWANVGIGKYGPEVFPNAVESPNAPVAEVRDNLSEGPYRGGKPFPDIVLNLDLDFFAPDLEDVPFELKRDVILAFARRSKAITVATSPCFIEPGRAISALRNIFG